MGLHGSRPPFPGSRFHHTPFAASPLATLAGFALGIAVLLLLRSVLLPALPDIAARLTRELGIPAWKRWLIALDSAVLEEILYRLFAVSGLAFLLRRLSHQHGTRQPNWTLWLPVLLVAFAFAATHLPAWFAVTAPRPNLILCVLAHFAADVVLHVLGPGVIAQAGRGSLIPG